MAKSFLRLDTRRALADGTYPIQIAVGYGTNLYLGTGISAKLENWDTATRLYVGPGAKRINNTLSTLLVQVSNRILDLRETGQFCKLTKAQLKAMLADMELDTPPVESKDTVGAVFVRVIATKNKRNAELYSATLQKLRIYCDIDKVRFEDINKLWLDGFNAYMADLAVNTRAIHLRNLRNVFNAAIDEEITSNYPFRRFKIETEETPMRVLPVESFRQLLDMDLDKRMAEYRDIFALMFYLIGINIVDLSRLTADSIIDGRLEYRRAKTGKVYSIKVESEAAAILERYAGKKHLLACFDRYENYKDYAQHINKAIRQLLPKYKTVSTYWARYSWATYAADIDIPKDTISECLGHQYGSRITGVYIKYSRDKIDAANRKVIDYLKK